MSTLIDGAAALAGLVLSLSQQRRLLSIETALPGDALVVERVRGSEGVNQLGEFEIDCLSPSAHLDLTALVGTELTLRLTQADGRPRTWHGYAMQAAALGADGGLARYRLTLKPWLAFLEHRRDCYLYQDASVLDIVADLFKDYACANWRAIASSSPIARRNAPSSARCASRARCRVASVKTRSPPSPRTARSAPMRWRWAAGSMPSSPAPAPRRPACCRKARSARCSATTAAGPNATRTASTPAAPPCS